jgi:hypothetical protein
LLYIFLLNVNQPLLVVFQVLIFGLLIPAVLTLVEAWLGLEIERHLFIAQIVFFLLATVQCGLNNNFFAII